eukprot:CAMPEP_0198198556 /NCGR_PEP_ID=MMETSP1445-20131203/2023_1 /TAXON_ID=36898 /ORGANISM="Pyramimonas sp., Strain CCMP2087" /LENGTH=74 /DNA_ID=CAMNT_0043868155 /DNA_START=77 /DNA_END=298 /DNA_ORIENTATION=-
MRCFLIVVCALIVAVAVGTLYIELLGELRRQGPITSTHRADPELELELKERKLELKVLKRKLDEILSELRRQRP